MLCLQFNQCQTQLACLYPEVLGSSAATCSTASGSGSNCLPTAGPLQGTTGPAGCVAEFVAYKVLYNAVHAHVGANKALLQTLQLAMSIAGTPRDVGGCVAHALAARSAAAVGNYPSFFDAYASAPALGRALLDSMVPRLRWAALNVLVKAYKTALPVSFLAGMLGFCVRAGRSISTPEDQQHSRSGNAGDQSRQQPLPGCRYSVYKGRAAPARSLEEGVQACTAWLRAHGAEVQEPGE